MTQKTIMVDGEEIPVFPAKAEEIIKNRVTGQIYNSLDEFNADVANPNTVTKAEDLQRDLKITVAPLELEGRVE
jgi:hypothetical protein